MKMLMRKCSNCDVYTLKASCPKCETSTTMPIPAKYSPEDRYGEYRRRLKKISDKKV